MRLVTLTQNKLIVFFRSNICWRNITSVRLPPKRSLIMNVGLTLMVADTVVLSNSRFFFTSYVELKPLEPPTKIWGKGQ